MLSEGLSNSPVMKHERFQSPVEFDEGKVEETYSVIYIGRKFLCLLGRPLRKLFHTVVMMIELIVSLGVRDDDVLFSYLPYQISVSLLDD